MTAKRLLNPAPCGRVFFANAWPVASAEDSGELSSALPEARHTNETVIVVPPDADLGTHLQCSPESMMGRYSWSRSSHHGLTLGPGGALQRRTESLVSRAKSSIMTRSNMPAAIVTLISKFLECVLTTLGTKTAGCTASKASPNFC